MIINFKIYKINQNICKLTHNYINKNKTRVLQFGKYFGNYRISIANSESALRISIPKFYFIV
jgi:hypothetical protein